MPRWGQRRSPVLASAGRHTITALDPDSRQARTVLDVPGGVDRIDVRLGSLQQASLPRTPPGGAAGESRLPMWIGIGATGALAVTTATLGILTLGASDLHASADRFGFEPARDIESLVKQDTLAVVTDVVLSTTIVAAGITTAIVLLRE